MYSISVGYAGGPGHSDPSEVVARHLRALADLRPVGNVIAELMLDDVQSARLEGVDRDGDAMVPIAESTRNDRRRGGDGPPLAPKGGGSRVVSGFKVDVNTPTPYQCVVVGSWPGLYWLKYHRTGGSKAGTNWVLPRRDPVGVRPMTRTLILDAARRAMAEQLGKGG